MKKIVSLIFLFCVSVVAVQPLLAPGFFPFHDDTQVARVYEMHKSLSDGQLPVRWVSDLGYGYGYPIFTFYAPLAYYVGGVSNFFVDSLMATKIMIIIGIVLAGFTMYLLSREFFGEEGGVLSGTLYLFAPFHALDVFVRGDVAELYAYAFIPLVFYALWRSYKNPSWIYVTIGSLSYAAVILSHNLTAMMLTPFLFIFAVWISYFLLRTSQSITRFYTFLILLLGVVLSSFYIIPVFGEMHYTNVLSVVGGGSNFRDHYLCLSQLWSGYWAYGGSIAGCGDGMSFQLGKIHILLSVLSVLTLFILLKKKKIETNERSTIVLLGLSGLLFSVWLMFSSSQWFWEMIPPMAFFQFPWRFLIMSTFFASLIGGSVSTFLLIILGKKKWSIFIACLLMAIITTLFYSKYFRAQTTTSLTVNNYTSPYALKWVTSKISDEYMPPGFVRPTVPKEVVLDQFVFERGTGVISIDYEKTQMKKISTTSSEDSIFLARIAPFPAWKVMVDSKSVHPIATNIGYKIPLQKGTHMIEFRYVQTTVEKIGNGISLAGILVLIVGIIYRLRRRVYEKKR